MNIQDAIKNKKGQTTIKGWVYRERGSKEVRFIVLRDTDNIIQCVVKKENVKPEEWAVAENLRMEASVEMKGELQADDRAPTGVELQVSSLKLVGDSDDFPIAKDHSVEHLANNRHLWLRSRKMNAMIKIRSTCFKAFRDYFLERGFYEYHSPIFQATQCEGGSDLFPVKYFDSEVFLAQTWQLYAEAGVMSVEKIFTIAPTFRAENSKTSRHLTEFWMAEMEVAWAEFAELQDHAEGVIKRMVKDCLDKHRAELEELGRDWKKLEPTLKKKFPRMTYTEALEKLKKELDFEVEWGKDLRTVEEDKLVSLYDTPVIVTEYPTKVKAFYMKEVAGNEKVVQGFDVLAPEGYGEIVGGSQREENIKKIIERLKRDGEKPEEYDYYLEIRKYGSVPHGGFGLGMERVIAWICGFDTVKDAIAFPRTPLRFKP